MKTRIDLNGVWNVKGADSENKPIEFVGNVPGCVHTDLMEAGIIGKDIFYRDNGKNIQWIEDKNFTYEREFEIKDIDSIPHDDVYLCFEGLDVYCDIYLNGKHIGYCEDMFIPHRFSVDGKLKEGKNTVTVDFYSPVNSVSGRKYRSGAFTTERLNTRRMQCTYGWDWVYRFVTCGIFRPVYIEFENGISAENVYINTESIDEFSAQISCEITFKRYEKGGMAKCEIYSPKGELVAWDEFYTEEEHHTRFFDIPDASLWDPFCENEASLYTARIYVDGVQYIEQKFGIRTVKILQVEDKPCTYNFDLSMRLKTNSASAERYDKNERFSCFTLMVNGKKIYCKGANWVPCEPFPSAETKEKITSILELAKKMNLNMIRVWGGGLFECDHFYSECDRLGIMVTQDFLMACGAYPEDNAHFVELLSKEAEHAALTLRNHPSIMWWSGDNENAVDGNDKMSEYMGRISAYKAIAPQLRKYDPRRRFLPSSPYGGDLYASKTVGTTHNTQYLSMVFDYIDSPDLSNYKEYYEEYLARFVAEEPAMGACSYTTLKKFMTEDDIFGENTDMWYFHTQNNPGLKKHLFNYNLMYAEKILGKYKDGKDRAFKLKYFGYEWVRFTFEKFRRNQWYNSGVIYWMLNDCWPAASGWAYIDYYTAPKPMYYAFKRCASKYIISIGNEKDKKIVRLCGNALTADFGTLTAYKLNKDGSVEKLSEKNVIFEANGVREEKLPEAAKDAFAVICDYSSSQTSDRCFYKDGALNIAPTDAFEIVAQTETSVTVKASKYIHTVGIEAEAVLSDNYFSLLPDEERTITFDKPCENIDIECYTLEELL